MSTKIVLVGSNGVGKTTFMHSIFNGDHLINPKSRIVNDNIRIGYYSQHSHHILDNNLTPVEFLMSRKYCLDVSLLNFQEINSKYNTKYANLRHNHNNDSDAIDAIDEFFCRKCLGLIGLENIVHKQKISTLSYGQKAKVVFAMLFVEKPHLILLDEPTNHLDIDTIDALITGINNFNGSVIIITHNIELIEKITNVIVYEIVDKSLTLTSFDAYRTKVLAQI